MITKKDDYNNVPVHYCTECLSLNITDKDKCVPCKEPTEISSTLISDWERMYEEKYGHKFLKFKI